LRIRDTILILVILIVIAPVGVFASFRSVHELQLAKTGENSGSPYFRLPLKQSETFVAWVDDLALVDSSVVASSSEDELSDARSRGWTGSAEKGRPIQNPTAALFKSMAVPGWGQVGNKQFIKAGFVVGLESFLFLKWLRFRKKTADARTSFEDAPDSDPNKTFFFNRFRATRNDRNLFAWLTGTAIFISMFDAFVDAHLSGFPKTKAGGGVSLAPFPGSVDERTVWGAQIKYSF